MTYRKLWPADRVARFDALKASAKHLGIHLKVERYGHAPAQMFRIVATDRAGTTTRLYDISEAEAWLAESGGDTEPPCGQVVHTDADRQIANLLSTSSTSMSAFKTQTLTLIEALQLPGEAVVGLGIGMAVAHGLTCGMDRDTLRNILDAYIAQSGAAAEAAIAKGGSGNGC